MTIGLNCGTNLTSVKMTWEGIINCRICGDEIIRLQDGERQGRNGEMVCYCINKADRKTEGMRKIIIS